MGTRICCTPADPKLKIRPGALRQAATPVERGYTASLDSASSGKASPGQRGPAGTDQAQAPDRLVAFSKGFRAAFHIPSAAFVMLVGIDDPLRTVT